MPLRQFANKTAVVAGGASGIGLAIAERLARAGCAVLLLDQHSDRIEEACTLLSGVGATVTGIPLDVTDYTAIVALTDNLIRDGQSVHLLINSAGVALAGPFAEASLEDLRWVMEVNFWGTVHLCKAFLPLLQREPESHILNVCSSFGLLGFANKTGYSASKFAVRGFSEALRMELRGTPTGLTVLYPGPVASRLVAEGRTTNENQRTAEAAFLARRAIPAPYVADCALHAIRRNRPRVLLSPDYRMIDLMTRLSPGLAVEIGAWMASRMPF